MRRAIAMCVLVTLSGVLMVSAEEVVSIWSKGAGAYLSVKGKTSSATSPSVGQTEKYVLKCDDATKDQATIIDISGRERGTFVLEDLGNSYFAFKKDGGYMSSDKTGKLTLKAGKVGDSEKFAVVPMRTGAKVCIRAYQGWEAKILVDHPGDYPTLKANVNTLQITPLLDPPHKNFYTEKILRDYRGALSTDRWETEWSIS